MTHVNSSLTDLFTGYWSPSHDNLCRFKVSVLAPLEWGHQTLSCFGFSTDPHTSCVCFPHFCLMFCRTGKLRVSPLLGRCSMHEPHPQPFLLLLIFQMRSHIFCSGQPGSWSSYLCLLCSWDNRWVQLVIGWGGGLAKFFPGLKNLILPISAS
jgi:hypothetical protein